jgi:hypothetical protein
LKIPDTIFFDTKFLYDPKDEFRLKMPEGLRSPKSNGYAFLDDGQILLVITDQRKLEDFEFYTHEFTEVLLKKIFQEIAEDDDICGERLCWLNALAHEFSPYGENKLKDEDIPNLIALEN